MTIRTPTPPIHLTELERTLGAIPCQEVDAALVRLARGIAEALDAASGTAEVAALVPKYLATLKALRVTRG